MRETSAAILLIVTCSWLFSPSQEACEQAIVASHEEGLGLTVICNGRNASIEWTKIHSWVKTIVVEYRCSNQTQPTHLTPDIRNRSPVLARGLPLTEPGTVCVFTVCYDTKIDNKIYRGPADQKNCSAVLPTSTLESGSGHNTISTIKMLPTSEHSSHPSASVSPLVLSSSTLESESERNTILTIEMLSTSEHSSHPSASVSPSERSNTIGMTVYLVIPIVLITSISIGSLSLSIYAVKRKAKRNNTKESDSQFQFLPEEVLKGLDILYTGGSEITISHALQMDEHEKEQTLFDNTLDDELSDSTEPSLSEMSPSCLNEEMDNISSSLHSSISITVPESAESETEMNVTKTEERGTQPCSPKKPVGLEDTGYLDFPSKCFSDGEATLSHLKYITGISLTDDYIDTSLCTEVH